MENLPGTALTLSSSVLSFLFGLIYLTRPRFMKYHRMAVQKDWNELVPEMQTLITALMRALSSGFLAVSFAIFILQLHFNKSHEPWIAVTILVIGCILGLGSLYAMILIRTRTQGRPPIILVSVIFLLLIAGFFFNIIT